MEYEHRQPAEDINVTQGSPLAHFLKLLVIGLVVVVILLLVINYSAAFLARKVPFEYELAVMERVDVPLGSAVGNTVEVTPDLLTDPPTNAHPMAVYLAQLILQLQPHMPLPEGMTFRLHYNDEDVFNAFATVGGNLVFYRGLLAEMPNENTLAMVMAHEMSHVLHRDPIAGLGGGVSSMVALMMLGGSTGGGVASRVLSDSGTLTQLTFSRKMELAADRQALAAIASYYGHVGGAAELFAMFGSQRDLAENFEWLTEFGSTHPLDSSRTLAVTEQATRNLWAIEGAMTPLPDGFQEWLQHDK